MIVKVETYRCSKASKHVLFTINQYLKEKIDSFDAEPSLSVIKINGKWNEIIDSESDSDMYI